MKSKYLKILLVLSVVILAAAAIFLVLRRGRVQQQESVRIAFVGPLTGDDASEGSALLRGISL